jgi:DNA primase
MIYDFDDLNQAFNAETWLMENYACEFYNGNNGWLNSCCPFPDHSDNSPSFGINLEKGIFQCFGCGRKGNFINLVSLIEEIPVAQAIKIISSHAGISLENFDSMDYKYEKFKRAMVEVDNVYTKNKRTLKKATMKIKKKLKENFEEADSMYNKLDELIYQNDYKKIKEIFL